MHDIQAAIDDGSPKQAATIKNPSGNAKALQIIASTNIIQLYFIFCPKWFITRK